MWGRMKNAPLRERRKVPPAKGLSVLTWSEIEQIDRHVNEVCVAGYGTVKISIEKGLPRFISKTQSEVIKPAGI